MFEASLSQPLSKAFEEGFLQEVSHFGGMMGLLELGKFWNLLDMSKISVDGS